MNTERARKLAASVLTEGTAAGHSTAELREAMEVLRFDAVRFEDSRPEQAGLMLLEFQVEMNELTPEMEN